MCTVTDKFYPKFKYCDPIEGRIESFSVNKKEISGFCGYYVSAKSDKKFDPLCAVEFSFECKNMPIVSIYAHSPYWEQPAFCNSAAEIPEKSHGIFFKQEDGTVTYVLTAVGSKYKTEFYGKEGTVTVKMYSQYADEIIDDQLAFIVGSGKNALNLANDGAKALAKFIGNGFKMRYERPMPQLFEYLGWCSWDAFAIRVSHDLLVEKAKEFKSKGVPVKFAIIDDMWGDAPNLKTCPDTATRSEMAKIMHRSSLDTFEGDKERFPAGLASAVKDMKKCGIDTVGLWFPTTAYWLGITENGPLHKELGDIVGRTNNERIMCLPDSEKAEKYFDILCAKAKDFGCDFVKIDNQGCHPYYKDVISVGESASIIQKAIDKAAFKYFDGALINCMGMPIECMYNRPESSVSRCSDDFLPENAAWFSKNVLECAFNGLIQGKFYVNDWDMWWTNDTQATKNAVCHAISGGPIYISDKLGLTDPEILKPLAFDDGRILILNESAVPTEDSVFINPTKSTKPFKIKNRFNGGGCVAAFNINDEFKSVSGSVRASDDELKAKASYLYYEYFTGDFGFVNGDEDIYFTLDTKDDIRYFTFIEKGQNKPIFIGRIDKFNSRLALIDQTADTVTLYEGGKFAFVCDEDYVILDEKGNEVEYDRIGIFCTGYCAPENKKLKFIKYDN